MEDVDNEILLCKMKPRDLAELVKLIDDGKISGKIAKQIFPELLKTGKSPAAVIKERGITQISDESEIEKIVKEVIAENTQIVDDIKKGKDRAVGFLVGLVMKKTKGQANPGIVNKLIRDQINA
jgi:aspartyl-tRNA(Asn)/glutamyl-tRNA(Gln) amidotransferase subunit B